MAKHNRRDRYWQYYEAAREVETSRLITILLKLVEEIPCPRYHTTNRGRPPVHSKAKLDFACLLMMADNTTYRNIESCLRTISTPWDDEPVPDHTTLVRHMQTLPLEWLDMILAQTAHLCIKEAGKARGPLGADSSGVETSRYENVERPDKKARDFTEKRSKTYLKYHITAMLGLQIILAAFTTSSRIHDTSMLKVMIGEIRRRGYDLAGYWFHADRGYDSDSNFEDLFWTGMIPNIRQRKDAVNTGKIFRRKGGEMFDTDRYKLRGLIEGIFGAEETKNHSLHCRFVREDNRHRFAKGRAIAWNIRAFSRFECANHLGIPIPSYEMPSQMECA